MRQTFDQQMAKAAWEQISSIRVDDEFLSSANGAASLIQSAGLGQAIAFWMAKGGKHKDLLKFLAQWLLRNRTTNEKDISKGAKDLMIRITMINSAEYRRLSTEALSYLNWLKRFAKANKVENHG